MIVDSCLYNRKNIPKIKNNFEKTNPILKTHKQGKKGEFNVNLM